MQWQVCLKIARMQQGSNRDARAIFVFGRNDVVYKIDLVQSLEDCVRIREVILSVGLVNVRDDTTILELLLRPARKVMAILGICTKVLRLQLQFVLHSCSGRYALRSPECNKVPTGMPAQSLSLDVMMW